MDVYEHKMKVIIDTRSARIDDEVYYHEVKKDYRY